MRDGTGFAHNLPVMQDTLKCYVSGRLLPDREDHGLVSFAVPEYGIMFRCYADGSHADLEIIAFLSFLRFVEHNLELFQKRELHIFTDFPVLAMLMNFPPNAGYGIEPIRREAKKVGKKVQFHILLIESNQNRAADPVSDIPAVPIKADLKIRTFSDLVPDQKSGRRPDDMKL